MGYGVVFGQMCWFFTLRKEMSLVLLRFYQVLEIVMRRKHLSYSTYFHYKNKNTKLIGPPASKIGQDFNVMWKQQFFPDKIFYRFIIVSQSKLLTEGDISRELQTNSLGYFELIILHFFTLSYNN